MINKIDKKKVQPRNHKQISGDLPNYNGIQNLSLKQSSILSSEQQQFYNNYNSYVPINTFNLFRYHFSSASNIHFCLKNVTQIICHFIVADKMSFKIFR